MSLLVIDFIYLIGRDGELVFKELAVADSHNNRVSSYMFKGPYAWEEVPLFTTRMNTSADDGYNWNEGDILYSVLENVLHSETSSAAAIYCYGTLKADFIGGLIERTVIDITQLRCKEPVDISYPTFSCTFTRHKS
jgi:hypothetical protein